MENNNNIKVDKSLVEVLSYCHLRELPKDVSQYDGIWIRAIAYVTKADATKSYVLMDKDAKGSSRIVKDFGTISPIVSIRTIHPFQFVAEEALPLIKGSNKQDRIDWLQAQGIIVNGELTLKQLNNVIVNYVIQQELKRQKI